MMQHFQHAIATARVGRVQRLLADAEALLAEAYRSRGDLKEARRHASLAVAETQASGARFPLPARFRVRAVAGPRTCCSVQRAQQPRYRMTKDPVGRCKGLTNEGRQRNPKILVPSEGCVDRAIGICRRVCTNCEHPRTLRQLENRELGPG
jgi:hypothetical protein